MKPLSKISGLVFISAFLCFLPCAFGQSTTNSRITGSGHAVLNVEPSRFLAFALTKGDEFFKGNNNNNNNNNGNNYNNNGKGGGCDAAYGKKANSCAAMPEGGTSLMYLLLAGFTCLGGMVLRSRREVSVGQN